MATTAAEPGRPAPADPAARAEAPLGELFRHTHEALAVVRLPEGTVVEANEAFLHLAEIPRDDLVGASSFELGFWAELGDDASARTSLCETPWHENLLATIATPWGKIATLHLSAELVRRDAGRDAMLVVRATEPSELAGSTGRFRMLREAEHRYQAFVQHLPAIVYTQVEDAASPTGFRDVYTSPQVASKLGYTPEEWQQDPALWIRATHPDDVERVMAEEEHSVATGEPYSSTYRLIAKDGRVLWFRDEAVLVEDPDTGLVSWKGIMFDVTEQKEAEQALHVAFERLRKLDALKATLLHALSHDLRGPITAIRAAAAALEDLDDQLTDEERSDLLRTIGIRSAKAEGLLSDLLDLELLDRGILEPRRGSVDLAALVRTGVDEAERLGTREVELDAAACVVQADGSKVERILDNLLANAVRYTPPGTPIRVGLEPAAGGCVLSVEDRGPGIPDEFKSEIFEVYRRGPSSDGTSGSGIGLSLVRRFAELHGGRAWVEDRPGGGASFRVFLPGDASPASGDRPAEASAPSPVPGPVLSDSSPTRSR
jgi:PAS domain S-box-containing protein